MGNFSGVATVAEMDVMIVAMTASMDVAVVTKAAATDVAVVTRVVTTGVAVVVVHSAAVVIVPAVATVGQTVVLKIWYQVLPTDFAHARAIAPRCPHTILVHQLAKLLIPITPFGDHATFCETIRHRSGRTE
jgi:hypothetical protein